VKIYWYAIVGLVAASVGVLGGCAGTPRATSSAWDIGDRPQILLPGATRSEVKGLAMGSARSKGWSIVSSSDDRLIVRRPLDPASPTALAVGASASTIAPTIEVTSAFVERSDGVVVALGAELVTQPPGEKAPMRVDYTETYREALNQSLESLRSNWTSNRQRIANAVPPESSRSEEAVGDADAANPLAQAWGQTLEEELRAKAEEAGSAPQPQSPAPQPRAPEPRVAASPPSAPQPSSQPPPVAPTAPAAPSTSAGGAPVVDGSNAVAARPMPAPRQAPTATLLPSVPVETVPPEENMLSLTEATGSGTWAYYAEQYARLRGCTLTEQGSILVETRSDSEIHRVPCVGADSYLLKCQNGVCRGLE
jgi:hypothetical protein